MDKKVVVYDSVTGQVFSVPSEGFKTSDAHCACDIDEAIDWLEKHNVKYEYDNEGDIAVKEVTWASLKV